MKSVQYVASGHDVANKKYSKNINIKSMKVKKKKKKIPPFFLVQRFPFSGRFMGILRRRVVRRVVHVGGEDVVLSPNESIGKSSQARQVLHVHYCYSCFLFSFVLSIFSLLFCSRDLFTVCRLEINGTYIYFFEILILHFLVGRTNVI